MLERNLVESELSLAYLHAVSAKCAFAVDIPRIDNDSIDAIISVNGKVSSESRISSAKIEVQLKASFNIQMNNSGAFSYSLPIKNYNDLRGETMVPRLLVVLALPQDEIEWLKHSEEKLTLQKCAYFLNLFGMPESNNSSSVTVQIPAENQFSPENLQALMLRASKFEKL